MARSSEDALLGRSRRYSTYPEVRCCSSRYVPYRTCSKPHRSRISTWRYLRHHTSIWYTCICSAQGCQGRRDVPLGANQRLEGNLKKANDMDALLLLRGAYLGAAIVVSEGHLTWRERTMADDRSHLLPL